MAKNDGVDAEIAAIAALRDARNDADAKFAALQKSRTGASEGALLAYKNAFLSVKEKRRALHDSFRNADTLVHHDGALLNAANATYGAMQARKRPLALSAGTTALASQAEKMRVGGFECAVNGERRLVFWRDEPSWKRWFWVADAEPTGESKTTSFRLRFVSFDASYPSEKDFDDVVAAFNGENAR